MNALYVSILTGCISILRKYFQGVLSNRTSWKYVGCKFIIRLSSMFRCFDFIQIIIKSISTCVGGYENRIISEYFLWFFCQAEDSNTSILFSSESIQCMLPRFHEWFRILTNWILSKHLIGLRRKHILKHMTNDDGRSKFYRFFFVANSVCFDDSIREFFFEMKI